MMVLIAWALVMLIGNVIVATIGTLTSIIVFNVLWVLVLVGLIVYNNDYD
jgi:hypothetical protein